MHKYLQMGLSRRAPAATPTGASPRCLRAVRVAPGAFDGGEQRPAPLRVIARPTGGETVEDGAALPDAIEDVVGVGRVPRGAQPRDKVVAGAPVPVVARPLGAVPQEHAHLATVTRQAECEMERQQQISAHDLGDGEGRPEPEMVRLLDEPFGRDEGRSRLAELS